MWLLTDINENKNISAVRLKILKAMFYGGWSAQIDISRQSLKACVLQKPTAQVEIS